MAMKLPLDSQDVHGLNVIKGGSLKLYKKSLKLLD